MNDSASTAAGYHRATSYRRHRIPPHALDWANQPSLVKNYPELPRNPLPQGLELPRIDYFNQACRLTPEDRPSDVAPDLNQIAAILQLSHGVTARAVHSGQPFYYRSVASAGALYPFELYLAVNGVDGLDAGLYHYDPLAFSLSALRRSPLPAIPKSEISNIDRPVAVSFYITGIFFRSAWKYRSRAYRYVLLDAGHLLENLRLALRALNQCISIHLDFDDAHTSVLLGLDPEREVCLACIHLHVDAGKGEQTGVSIELEPLGADIRRASRVSGREMAYPEILNIHRAGSGGGGSAESSSPRVVPPGDPLTIIDLESSDHPVTVDYTQVLVRRRSRRNFIPAGVSRGDFMTFLQIMAKNMGSRSGMPAACRSALTAGILAGENMPVPPGFYLLDPEKRQLEQRIAGSLIEAMAAACLDQMWLKHAGLHLLFLTDPTYLDEIWGARGYRYAMIEAGRLGQQAYLAATALGWGACGIGAIYDREAADLLGLTESGALVYLVGLGPVKTSPGKTR
jgi:SagB-type dehydrogenase family enzyme